MSQHNHSRHQREDSIRLSPVFNPKASSSNTTRLYDNKNGQFPNQAHRDASNDIMISKTSYIEDKLLSTSIDSVKHSNTTHLPHNYPVSKTRPVLRDIFSPVPKPDTNASSSSTIQIDDFSSLTTYVPSSPSLQRQTERRASDIVFPSIKVDNYCDEGATSSTPSTSNNNNNNSNNSRLLIHEKRSHSTGNLISSGSPINRITCIENNINNNNNNNNNKCLMVPPTLVRTRSTDGRLMVGTKDRAMFPTISKAWSKSEGNIFSERPHPSSIPTPTPPTTQRIRQTDSTTRSKSHEIKPEDAEFQLEEYLLSTKPYKKLGPIIPPMKSNQFSPDSHSQETTTLLSLSSGSFQNDSPSSDVMNSPWVTTIGQSVSENNIVVFQQQRNRPTTLLNVFGDPDGDCFSSRQHHRSKSHSPRRRSHNHLKATEVSSFLADGEISSEENRFADNSREEWDNRKRQGNSKVFFLSPQPMQKLGPIQSDKSDT